MTAVDGKAAATSENGEPPVAAPAPLPLRRNRDFNLLWSGQALSDMGTQMSTIAYPLLILALTGSAAKAGIVGSATIVGTLLWLLPAGVAADRWPRKKIMLTTSIIQLIVGGSVVPAIVTHHVYLIHLVIVGFVQGSALAFYTGAARGALRRVVPLEQLPEAFSRTQARDRAAVMLGPPIGSTLFSVAPYLPFAVDSVSFGAITLAASLMRKNLNPDKSSIPLELQSMRMHQRVLLGMRYVFSNPYLRMVVIWATVVNGVIAGVRLTSIVLAEHLGASAPEIGTLFSISAAIGLVGAIFAKRIVSLLGERRLVQLVSIAFPLCSLGMAYTPSFWLISIAAGLTGLFLMPINVVLMSRAAQLAPDHLQAQMSNAMQLCWTSLMAVSPAIFGTITDRIGPRAMITVAAAIYALIAVWMLSRKSMNLLQRKGDSAVPDEVAAKNLPVPGPEDPAAPDTVTDDASQDSQEPTNAAAESPSPA
jgi:MFS family permease